MSRSYFGLERVRRVGSGQYQVVMSVFDHQCALDAFCSGREVCSDG
jgi:hypothetical protein